MTWSDGSAFTADDVAFTINLAQNKAIGSNLFDFVDQRDRLGNDVVVKFKANPAYQEWAQWLYNSPIVRQGDLDAVQQRRHPQEPQHERRWHRPVHVQDGRPGPHGLGQRTRHWWATKALNLNVQPKYIVDIVNSSNNVALGQLLAGGLDLDNNYLPGIAQIVNGGYGVTTYFAGPALHAVGQHRVARSEHQEEAP